MHLFASAQTDTASITVQNISGNTVERDAARAFAVRELIGALVVIRIWRGDGEEALFTFIGNVTEALPDENKMVLTIEGFGNWSAVNAVGNMDTGCPLTFGSVACGSTSSTPCDQTFGTCSSVNRFQGVITQWISEAPNVQIAIPEPVNTFNTRRAF